MSSNLVPTKDLAAQSTASDDEPTFPFHRSTPNEILIGIIEYLDHESLNHLTATTSCLKQLVVYGMNSHWKVLHDSYWTQAQSSYDYRGLNKLTLPPLPPPVITNWRCEFKRRFLLDKSVPGRLARLSALKGKAHDIEHRAMIYNLGLDIYDKMKTLSETPDFAHQSFAEDVAWTISYCYSLPRGPE